MAAPLHNALDRARQLDECDPLHVLRERFHVPRDVGSGGGSGGAKRDLCYLAGNSLGLMPKRAKELVDQELDDWRDLAVEAHFKGRNPWFPYADQFRESGARLVGGKPGANEVVMMNSLTTNLHLLMASFYKPTPERHKVLIESPAFPSDEYAVRSQIRFHGLDPKGSLVKVEARKGERTIRREDLLGAIEREGESLALVLLAGVNYVTGQVFPVEQVAKGAHEAGACCGIDLAHAAGNVPLHLHDWGVDFAVWCSYKYLNSGPGAIGGAFVHEKHFEAANGGALPRLEGWWSNDPATRFRMRPELEPAQGAEAWALSNPPILSAAPLRASLDIFDEATMPRLREKSLRLTGFLLGLLDEIAQGREEAFEVVTPRTDADRGCQISLAFENGAKELQQRLMKAGVVADFREPNILRVAPAPSYNTFADCARFAAELHSRL